MRKVPLGRVRSGLISWLMLLTRAPLLGPSSGLARVRLGDVLVAVRLVARILSLLRLFGFAWDRCLFRNCDRMGGAVLTLCGSWDWLTDGAEDVLHQLRSRVHGFAAADAADELSGALPLGRRLEGFWFVRLVNRRSHRGIARGRLVSEALLILRSPFLELGRREDSLRWVGKTKVLGQGSPCCRVSNMLPLGT
jgi:hypothetical protein